MVRGYARSRGESRSRLTRSSAGREMSRGGARNEYPLCREGTGGVVDESPGRGGGHSQFGGSTMTEHGEDDSRPKREARFAENFGAITGALLEDDLDLADVLDRLVVGALNLRDVAAAAVV